MKQLALCMIVKGNEWEEETKRCLDAVVDYVDAIFVTTTQEHIHPEYPKVVWSTFDWVDDFSEAREFNFTQAEGFKYCLWLDSDDILQNPELLPDIVKKMNALKLDGIYCDYNYTIDENGNVVIVHPRERIVVNNGTYKWKGALHETLVSNKEVRTKYIKDIFVNHYPSEESHVANLQRNLDIMGKRYHDEAKQVQEGKRKEIDPRTEYYLARILFDTHEEKAKIRAAELLQDYLQHSGWDEERAQAWNYLARIFMDQQSYDDAINCCLSAKKEANQYPTWDIMLANVYCAKGDFKSAKIAVTQALSLEQPNTSLIVSPQDDQINALIALFLISFNEKDLKKALRYAEEIDEIRSSNDSKERIKTVSELIEIGEWMKSMDSMVSSMGKNYKQIESFIANSPEKIKNTVFLQQLRNDHLPPRVWSEKSIVYYAASDFENWSPKSLKGGIGGSEEAIIYLANEWTKLGYEVTVYAKVGKDEGEYNGVTYLNYQKFNPHDHFNVLIGWRNPYLFKYNTFSAKLTLLDLHDVPQPNDYDDEVISKVDFIMVKSKYHRSLLPNIPNNKFIIIGNGIDSKKLAKVKGKHKRYKIFWGSSYDRGLQHLLANWKQIKDAEPLAELHICYGWNLFDKVYEHLPHMKEWRKQMERMMTQPGIVHHGRVGKDELYSIAAECGVWAYSTEFQEIDCITARYCQAIGTVPVVTDFAALQTTVRYGEKVQQKGDGTIDTELYIPKLIEVVKNGYSETIRDQMKKECLNDFSWEKTARKWVSVFNHNYEQDIKVSIITPTIRTGWWNIMADNLSKQNYKNFEWIIVDDYEQDRSSIAIKYAEKYGLDIQYIRPGKRTAKAPRKYGLSSANNIGWKASGGELCVWLQDFVLIKSDALEKLVHIHRHNPYSFIAPVDKYHSPTKVNLKNKEDWFDGDTNVVGKHLRDNARIDKGWLKESDHLYDLELNFGAIPRKLLEDLNGFWEFYDDALGYDDTEIVYRGFQLGARLLIDETNVCLCLDHWESLEGTNENGVDREHNLNDPRFVWMVNKMESGDLDIKRDQEIDDKIDLKYQIPPETDQDGAVAWMKKNLESIVEAWQ